jgi:hypothetical protein
MRSFRLGASISLGIVLGMTPATGAVSTARDGKERGVSRVGCSIGSRDSIGLDDFDRQPMLSESDLKRITAVAPDLATFRLIGIANPAFLIVATHSENRLFLGRLTKDGFEGKWCESPILYSSGGYPTAPATIRSVSKDRRMVTLAVQTNPCNTTIRLDVLRLGLASQLVVYEVPKQLPDSVDGVPVACADYIDNVAVKFRLKKPLSKKLSVHSFKGFERSLEIS